MLGDFITRILLMVLGYAYPAFECYKTVEKNRVDIEELRFWCQYWIIVAMLTVLERFGDIFISWLPMYEEMKLALVIYLWYPKTKGSSYVYESLLRPYIANHETDIDHSLKDLRGRIWSMALYYWQNYTELGQEKVSQLLHFLAPQSGRGNSNGKEKPDEHRPSGPPPPPPNGPASFLGQFNMQQPRNRRRGHSPSAPPLPPGTFNRAISQPTDSDLVQLQLDSRTEFLQVNEASTPDLLTRPESEESKHGTRLNEKPHASPFRLRRSRPH